MVFQQVTFFEIIPWSVSGQIQSTHDYIHLRKKYIFFFIPFCFYLNALNQMTMISNVQRKVWNQDIKSTLKIEKNLEKKIK